MLSRHSFSLFWLVCYWTVYCYILLIRFTILLLLKGILLHPLIRFTILCSQFFCNWYGVISIFFKYRYWSIDLPVLSLPGYNQVWWYHSMIFNLMSMEWHLVHMTNHFIVNLPHEKSWNDNHDDTLLGLTSLISFWS